MKRQVTSLKLDAAEREMIALAAAADGIGLTTYIRRAALAMAASTRDGRRRPRQRRKVIA